MSTVPPSVRSPDELKEMLSTPPHQASKTHGDDLQDLKNELKRYFDAFKQLDNRCHLPVKNISVKEKNDERVFYYPLETPFLDDPQKQRSFRDKVRRMASEIPQPPRIHLYADILHKKRLQMLEDHSAPHTAILDISTFFRRRLSTLQHRKYKTIQRWARFGHRSQEIVDIIGLKAGYVMGKIQLELDNCVQRISRLSSPDDYTQSFNTVRPQPRPPAAIYEKSDRHAPKNKDPAKESDDLYEKYMYSEHHSLLRQDDLQVYLRLTTYMNKTTRPLFKIANILKMLPLSRRFQIFKRSRRQLAAFRNEAMEQQAKLEDEVLVKMKDSYLSQIGTTVAHLNSSYIREVIDRCLHRFTLSKEEKELQTDYQRGELTFQLDYDFAPALVDNICELKVKLTKLAAQYGLYGNVDLDNGYSFAYLVTLFFPNGLQDALDRINFKDYDAHAIDVDYKVIGHRHLPKVATLIKINEERKEEETKKNEKEQPKKQDQPSVHFHQKAPIKAYLNPCFVKKATWLSFISFRPNIPDYQKIQDVRLTQENQIDTLLKNTFFSLHISSIAEVNKILEEAALSHKNRVYNRMKTRQEIEKVEQRKQTEERHFQNALHISKPGGAMMKRLESQQTSRTRPTHSSPQNTTRVQQQGQIRFSELQFTPTQTQQLFQNIPPHILKSMYSLRHINTLEYRIRLLHQLNFFRALQKRFAMDALQTFSRERLQGHATVIPPVESVIERQGKPSEDPIGVQSVVKTPMSQFKNDSVADLKAYRYNQQFVNRFTSTNPVIPLLHAPFSNIMALDKDLEESRPLPRAQNFVNMMTTGVLEKEFKNFKNRADNLQLLESPLGSEVSVKDEFGVRVVYDAALDDLDMMEEHLMRIGSYFIRQHEYLLDSEKQPSFPALDRTQIASDLYKWESEFQAAKIELLFGWLEVYEHICDLVEQNRLIQMMTDLMARRPRFNLDGAYFKSSYEAEIKCLEKQTEVLKNLTRYQMENERKEMNELKEFLQTKYKRVKEHLDEHWKYYKYNKPEETPNTKTRGRMTQSQIDAFDDDSKQEVRSPSPEAMYHEHESIVASSKIIEEKASYQSKYTEKTGKIVQESQNATGTQRHSSLYMRRDLNFARVLGLPRITLQQAFDDFNLEGDPTVMDKLHEQANFIKLEEGYPILHNAGLNSPTLVINLTPGVQDQLRPITMLDFYESLVSLTRVQVALNHAFGELKEPGTFPPENTIAEISLQIALLDQALSFISEIKSELSSHVDGSYYVRNLEDGLLVDKPDKLAFAVKEAHVEIEDKNILKNPYIVGRLDLEIIQNFNFPVRREAEVMFGAPFVNKGEIFLEKLIGQEFSLNPGLLRFQTHVELKSGKQPWPYQAPPILHFFCNCIEVLRLREHLIRAVVETQQMEKIYNAQLDIIKAEKKQRPMAQDALQFGQLLNDANFVDAGPATGEWKGPTAHNPNGLPKQKRISAVQFDSTMIALLDFGSIDCIKALCLRSGVEQMRAVLHYQLTHLHALTIAVLFNQKLLDGYAKIQAEVELLQNYNLVTGDREPILVAPTHCYLLSSQAYHLFDFGVERGHKDVLATYLSGVNNKLINKTANTFVFLNNIKYPHRASVLKRYFSLVSKHVPIKRKMQIRQRLQRVLRIRLLHQFCEQVNRDMYLVALKLQTASEMEALKISSFKLPPMYQCFASSPTKNELDGVLGDYSRAFFLEMTTPSSSQSRSLSHIHNSQGSLSTISDIQHATCLIRPVFHKATEAPKSTRRMPSGLGSGSLGGGFGGGALGGGGGGFGLNFSSSGAKAINKPKVLGYAIQNILHIPSLDQIALFDKHLPQEALLKINPHHESMYGSFTSTDQLQSLMTDLDPEQKFAQLHFDPKLNPHHPLTPIKQRLYEIKNGRTIPCLRSADFMAAFEYPEAIYYPFLILSLTRRIFEMEIYIQLFASTVNQIVEMNEEVWRKKVIWPDQDFHKAPEQPASLFAQREGFALKRTSELQKNIAQAAREAYPQVAQKVIKWAFEKKKLKADLQDDLRFVQTRMETIKSLVEGILKRKEQVTEEQKKYELNKVIEEAEKEEKKTDKKEQKKEAEQKPKVPELETEQEPQLKNNEEALQFLILYYEYRFLTLQHACEKMQDHYYKVKSNEGVVETAQMLTRLTGRDQWLVTLDNSFRVRDFSRLDLMSTDTFLPCVGGLETSGCIGLTHQDHSSYLQCVRPLIDENAMIAPQLGVFETVLEGYHDRRVLGNVAQQTLSTKIPAGVPNTLAGPLTWGLSLLPLGDRQYFLSELKALESGVTNTLEAYGYPKHHTAGLITSLETLSYGRGLITAQIQARQLKWFVMQWISERATIPLDPTKFQELEKQYKDMVFWKEMKAKDMMMQKTKQLRLDRQKHNPKLKQDKDEESQSKGTSKSKAARRQEDALIEGVSALKLQSFVCCQELERQLILLGINTLKREHSGLMSALEMSARELEVMIHPHQHFATTLFPFLDRNAHLDLINKVAPIQSFLSRLRNRCTEINTLTTGPGMVFSLKDFNECIYLLARQLLKWGELEMRSRVQTGALQARFLQHVAYCREQEKNLAERKLKKMESEIAKIVNARLSESSAHLIYELDTVSRELRLMKDNIYTMEARVRQEVEEEYDKEMERAAQQLQVSTERFNDFREDVMNNLKGEIMANKNNILQMILNIFMKYKGDMQDGPGRSLRLRHDPSRSVLSTEQSERTHHGFAAKRIEQMGQIGSAASSKRPPPSFVKPLPPKSKLGQIHIVPYEGVELNTSDSQQKLSYIDPETGSIRDRGSQKGISERGRITDRKRDKAPLELMIEEDKEIDAAEAKAEIVEMGRKMRQLRILYKMREVTKRDQFKKEIHKMKLQLTSNSALWEELSEAQRREQIVSQELLYTQQSLAACEKIIENLGGEIYDLSNQKLRLERYKENKGKRLEELEGRIKNLVVMEQVNTDKLIAELRERKKVLSELRQKEELADERIKIIRNAEQVKFKELLHKYRIEKSVKQNAIKRIDMMRAELLALETSQEDVERTEAPQQKSASRNEWKRKCIELFEIATSLQDEVDQLRMENETMRENQRNNELQTWASAELQTGNTYGYGGTGNPSYSTLPAEKKVIEKRNHSEQHFPRTDRSQSISLSKNLLKPSASHVVSPSTVKAQGSHLNLTQRGSVSKPVSNFRPSIDSTAASRNKLSNLLGLNAPVRSSITSDRPSPVKPKHERSHSMISGQVAHSSIEVHPTQMKTMKPSPMHAGGYHPSNDSLVTASMKSPSTADLDTNRQSIGVAAHITPHHGIGIGGPPSLFSQGKETHTIGGSEGVSYPLTSRTQHSGSKGVSPVSIKQMAGQMIIQQQQNESVGTATMGSIPLNQKGSLSTIMSGADNRVHSREAKFQSP